MKRVNTQTQFVICIRNYGYLASLELRKIYQVLPDEKAVKHGLIRIIDESGEDYLFSAEFFVAIDLPEVVERAVSAAA